MTVSVKHAFASAKSDSGDPTLIQPSNWNAEHAITLGAGKVLGRDASGAGAVQELPLAFDATGQSMIPPNGTIAQRPGTPIVGMTRYNTDTGRLEAYISGLWVALLTTIEQEPTGKIGQFLLASAPAGWVPADGTTIGDASSGATRANADTAALFTAMWNLTAAVSAITTSVGGASSRGGSAAADYAAHKRLVVPDIRGDFVRGLDNGRGIDVSRVLGSHQAFATSASGLAATASSSASATSSFVGNALPAHNHTVPANGLDNSGSGLADGSGSLSYNVATSGDSAGTPSGSVSTSVSVTTTVNSITGATETRPANTAALICVKL